MHSATVFLVGSCYRIVIGAAGKHSEIHVLFEGAAFPAIISVENEAIKFERNQCNRIYMLANLHEI